MRRNTKVDTKPELRLRSLLHSRGLRFRKNLLLRLNERTVRPDIVFTRQRLAVFVDGCFWHRCPQHGTSPRFNTSYWQGKLDRNVERDRQIDEALQRDGWVTVRLWEHESVESAAQHVIESLQRASGDVSRRRHWRG
jgi:DNA mismatch endonuclease (patch repair protein)